MMLNLYVQQHQWIIITLLTGVALMLLFCLTYSAMWRPRGEEEKSETAKVRGTRGFFRWVLSFVPWVLILLAITSISFTVVTVLAKACRPPNW